MDDEPKAVAERGAEGYAAFNAADYATALSVLEPLALEGDAKAQLWLGHMYRLGFGVVADAEKGTGLILESAAQGYGPARQTMAEECSIPGISGRVPPDYREKAIEWLHDDADHGDLDAQVRLGFARLMGAPGDREEALRWLVRAAEQGHIIAQMRLGWIYTSGALGKRDYAEALFWYRAAAAEGNVAAARMLGEFHEEGRNGAPANIALARAWYRKAAAMGDMAAAYNLGEMYWDGRGVARDRTEAVRWYRRAAELGSYQAAWKVGKAYAAGRVVARNYLEAYVWLALVALRADALGVWDKEESARARDAVAVKLAPAQVEVGGEIIGQLKGRYLEGCRLPP